MGSAFLAINQVAHFVPQKTAHFLAFCLLKMALLHSKCGSRSSDIYCIKEPPPRTVGQLTPLTTQWPTFLSTPRTRSGQTWVLLMRRSDDSEALHLNRTLQVFIYNSCIAFTGPTKVYRFLHPEEYLEDVPRCFSGRTKMSNPHPPV